MIYLGLSSNEIIKICPVVQPYDWQGRLRYVFSMGQAGEGGGLPGILMTLLSWGQSPVLFMWPRAPEGSSLSCPCCLGAHERDDAAFPLPSFHLPDGRSACIPAL